MGIIHSERRCYVVLKLLNKTLLFFFFFLNDGACYNDHPAFKELLSHLTSNELISLCFSWCFGGVLNEKTSHRDFNPAENELLESLDLFFLTD